MRAEVFDDRWEVPNLPQDPRDTSYYLEVKQKVAAGWYAAVRYGAIHFNRLTLSNGDHEQWDYDVRRWQVAAGYRIAQSVELRTEYMWNRLSGPLDPDDNLFSLQVRWEY